MDHARLFAAASIIGAVAALTGAVTASAAQSSSPAARAAAPAVRAAQPNGVRLPSGVRPARPPRPGTGIHMTAHFRDFNSGDSIGCWDQQSLVSEANSHWVSAELSYTGDSYAMLRASAISPGSSEQFSICFDYTTNYWYIVSDANGLAVSAEVGDSGSNYAMLRARATAIGSWEQFTLACTSGTLIIISNADDLAVSTELNYTGSNYAMLRARAGAIGPWEEYNTAGNNPFGC